VSLIAVALLVNFATKRPNWGHVHNSAARLGIGAAPLPSDAMVIIAGGEPVAYLALGLPDSTPLVAVANNILSPAECSGLQLRARQAISTHAGSLWLLSPDETHAVQDLALLSANYGLDPGGECRDYANSLGPARLCPLVRTAPMRACL
jgi:hypothetical protein